MPAYRDVLAIIEAELLEDGHHIARDVSMDIHHLDGRGVSPTDPLVSDPGNLLPSWP